MFNQLTKRVYIIAELSANHNGSLETALQTVIAAKKAGADAIKLQTYTADTMTIKCDNDDFKIKGGTLWDNQYLYDLYLEAYTPWEWHEKIFEVANNVGLDCFSTPFDISAVDFLENLKVPAYKIASFEITDIPLIRYVASKDKPIIISTGIAQLEDIQLAVETCRSVGNNKIILLKCTSSYPAPLAEANLIMIKDMAARFNVPVGLSDHTMETLAPVLAVAFGATVIEKHFILDRSMGGPDAAFSLNVAEFSDMVRSVRLAEQAIGKCDYSLSPAQQKGRVFGRSIYITQDIAIGEVFTKDNIRSIRPSFGLHPKYLDQVLGKKSNSSLKKGQRLELTFIAED